jgi:phosphohistidine phosphatase
MKHLFLIRHAKSSWDEEGLADRDRPLNDRGKRDAPKMGQRLAGRGVQPDLILSSPAVRALTTAEIMAREMGYKRKAIIVDERIYAAEPEALLAVIAALDDAHNVVMLFGHNPELTAIAHRFSNEIDDMPTCSVAEFTFDVARWRDVPAAKPGSVTFETPKKAR